MWFPSGEKPAEVTNLVCPLRGFTTSSPVLASHIRIVLSAEPDTMWFPSGEKPAEVTLLVCPLRGFTTSSPVLASHIRIVWSRARHDVVPIWREASRGDSARMSLERLHDLLACPRIPYSDRMVVRARHDVVPIWREASRGDGSYVHAKPDVAPVADEYPM
jgi:hypothetical protein